MVEVWSKVPGYEDLYIVSNHGRVKSLDRIDTAGQKRTGRTLKLCKNSGGYLQIQLCKDGKRTYSRVHRLVMEAFVGPCPEGYEVNHIDEDKTNNRLDNLEYVTHKQNINHGTVLERSLLSSAGQKEVAVRQLTLGGELVEEYPSQHEAERITGVDNSSITKCCKGKRKTAGGYRWELV